MPGDACFVCPAQRTMDIVFYELYICVLMHFSISRKMDETTYPVSLPDILMDCEHETKSYVCLTKGQKSNIMPSIFIHLIKGCSR